MAEYTHLPCAVCGKEFDENSDVVVCPVCGTPHHRECYKQLGHCAIIAWHEENKTYECKIPGSPRFHRELFVIAADKKIMPMQFFVPIVVSHFQTVLAAMHSKARSRGVFKADLTQYRLCLHPILTRILME